MDIWQALKTNSAVILRRVGNSHGGEYKSPCPWCGGRDRFTIYADYKSRGNWYVCRKCGKTGDTIQFFRDFLGLSFPDALEAAGENPKTFKTDKQVPHLSNKTEIWTPRKSQIPVDQWRRRAEYIAFQAFKSLMSARRHLKRKWLNDRGLKNETIKAARLGWIDSTTKYARESWGIENSTPGSGVSELLKVPEGFCVPFFDNALISRLRVRQANPLGNDKYYIIPGSNTDYFRFPIIGDTEKPAIVVESELDGWLIWQDAGDLVDVFAVGNSTARPDIVTHKHLKNRDILLCLDFDGAGLSQLEWWEKQYSCELFPVIIGKDPGEAYQQGLNIRDWISAGIKPRGKPVTKPVTKKNTESPKPLENRVSQEKKTVTKPVTESEHLRICDHGGLCPHLQYTPEGARVCLVAKKLIPVEKYTTNIIFDLSDCPRGKWRRIDCGVYDLIIHMPQLKKRY